ncbi:UDP-N-acetylglucosamine 2-epimerase [Nitrococcus mobilis Nb-231]|uniref:UDP-N-acetylglucosamine 2-epimerase n=2 Tax=Nitrococcus mobilis TaxID=35797 RepID=A4BMH7_9GAMM|nr:UDP-N-acetylglucosamine 2-epimerase [Nitrococcus mobilis Nb-231]
MTLVGTRPEVIKLSRVIAELDRYTDHLLVHSGQNYDYELNEIFFNDLGIRSPDRFLNVACETAAGTISQVIARADELMGIEQPDAFLIYGDTNTCLAVIAAKRRQIPIFHMEAGNRCFDQRVPEELNRKIVDHLSDINLPLTEHARRYLLAEGIRPEMIIKTGSPMKEILAHYRDRIESSDVLERLGVETGGYFLVSAHREENVDTPRRLSELLDSLKAIAAEYRKPIIMSTHPRTRHRMEGWDLSGLAKHVRFLKPLGFLDYVQLQKSALCVLSDSGTITEEAALLNLRGVMIRDAHERPEGMDRGTIIMAGLESNRILQAVATILHQHPHRPAAAAMVPDYDVDRVSEQVVRVIMSYVDYVNRTVWHKS